VARGLEWAAVISLTVYPKENYKRVRRPAESEKVGETVCAAHLLLLGLHTIWSVSDARSTESQVGEFLSQCVSVDPQDLGSPQTHTADVIEGFLDKITLNASEDSLPDSPP
jgi:hypothetical protein